MLLHSDVYIWCHPWCKCIYVVFAVKIQICVVYSIAISFISTSDNINYSFHTSINTMMSCAMVDLESHGSFGITTTFQYYALAFASINHVWCSCSHEIPHLPWSGCLIQRCANFEQYFKSFQHFPRQKVMKV